jgi:predicted nucleic acid-binding protein
MNEMRGNGSVIFADTNVWFYAQDGRDPAKQRVCQDWLMAMGRRRVGCANLQVANEFTHIVLRKRQDIAVDTVFRMADYILAWGSAAIEETTVTRARSLRLKTPYAWWDCLLLASALELGCTHFLSEDMQDGQQIESLTIVDPFAHSPEQILASP